MPANQLTRQQRQALANLLQDRYLVEETSDTVPQFMDALNAAGFTLISDRRRMPLYQELTPEEIQRISEASINSIGIAIEAPNVRNLCSRLEDQGLAIIRLVRTPRPMPETAIRIQPLIDRLVAKGDEMRFNGFEYSPEGIRVSYARFKGKDALYFRSIALFEKWLNGLAKAEKQPGQAPEVKPAPLPPSGPDTRPTRGNEEAYPVTIAEALERYTATRTGVENMSPMLSSTEARLVHDSEDSRFLNAAQRHDAIRHLKSLNLRTTPTRLDGMSISDYDRWLKQHAERRGWSPVMAGPVRVECPVTVETRTSLLYFIHEMGQLGTLARRQYLFQRQIDMALVARAYNSDWRPGYRTSRDIRRENRRNESPLSPGRVSTERELRNLLDRENSDAYALWDDAGMLATCPGPNEYETWDDYTQRRVAVALENPNVEAHWVYYAPTFNPDTRTITNAWTVRPAVPVPAMPRNEEDEYLRAIRQDAARRARENSRQRMREASQQWTTIDAVNNLQDTINSIVAPTPVVQPMRDDEPDEPAF